MHLLIHLLFVIFPNVRETTITVELLRGKAMDRRIIFINQLPSVYQCVQMCLNVDICKCLAFNTQSRICNLSDRTFLISELISEEFSIFAQKQSITSVSCINICLRHIIRRVKASCIRKKYRYNGIVYGNFAHQITLFLVVLFKKLVFRNIA